MSLSRKIADAVESLPAGAELPRLVEAEDLDARLALDLAAAGPVGIAFNGLDFASTDRAELSGDGLRAWGDRLAARLTYLMEPLVVLEVDAEAGQAELRKQVPHPPGRPFLVLRGSAPPRGGPRAPPVSIDQATRQRATVPCRMTVEVLERLADDLVASLA